MGEVQSQGLQMHSIQCFRKQSFKHFHFCNVISFKISALTVKENNNKILIKFHKVKVFQKAAEVFLTKIH